LDLKLIVASSNSTAEGVFQVFLNSSLGISGCNLNQTNPNNNTTPTNNTHPTPVPSKPPTVTAGAARYATAGFSMVGFALVAAFL
jgi:hypothetical protein